MAARQGSCNQWRGHTAVEEDHHEPPHHSMVAQRANSAPNQWEHAGEKEEGCRWAKTLTLGLGSLVMRGEETQITWTGGRGALGLRFAPHHGGGDDRSWPEQGGRGACDFFAWEESGSSEREEREGRVAQSVDRTRANSLTWFNQVDQGSICNFQKFWNLKLQNSIKNLNEVL